MLQTKYYLLLSRLRKPKDTILELLPMIIARSILFILQEKFQDSLDQIFGLIGHSQECPLFVYQYVIKQFNQGVEMPLNSVDKLFSKIMSNEKQ